MVQTKVKYLYPEEVPLIINWLEETGATKKRLSSKITYQQIAAFGHLAYEHGLRVNEAVDLQWGHNIQETEGIYRLKVQRQKGSELTDQPMSVVLVQRLEKLRQSQAKYWLGKNKQMLSSWVFLSVLDPTGHITDKVLDLRLREATKALGWNKSATTSLFKHACGIQMARAGKTQAFIQKWLGHVDFSSTEWYLKFAPGVINQSPWE